MNASEDRSKWEHLIPYGYAPGNYMNKCHACKQVVLGVDKRATTCRPCAEARHKTLSGQPVPCATERDSWDCKNMLPVDDDTSMTHEHYACKVCGRRMALDYDEIR